MEEVTFEINENIDEEQEMDYDCPVEDSTPKMKEKVMAYFTEHPAVLTELVKAFFTGAIGLGALGCVRQTKKWLRTETEYKRLFVANELDYRASLRK